MVRLWLYSFVILLKYTNICCIGNPTTKAEEVKFDQSIKAVGVPYYKLQMSLGSCNKTLLFQEEKAWGRIRYNRVLDIYYRSSNPDIVVSKVEITVVLDNTDCSVYSREGVGKAEFAATMFIPTRVSMIFYQLKIWTCSEATNEESRQYEMSVNSQEKYEDVKINKMPLYSRPLRPDVGPHHIYYDPTNMYVHTNKHDTYEESQSLMNQKETTLLPLNFAVNIPEKV